MFAAGFVSYDAAEAFDPALKTQKPDTDLPLLQFGIYEEAKEFSRDLIEKREFNIGSWAKGISKNSYIEALTKVKDYIESPIIKKGGKGDGPLKTSSTLPRWADP